MAVGGQAGGWGRGRGRQTPLLNTRHTRLQRQVAKVRQTGERTGIGNSGGSRNSPGSGRWCRHLGRRSPYYHRPDHCGCSLRRQSCHSGTYTHFQALEARWIALTAAVRQAGHRVTVRGPSLADAGRAGVRFPASPLRPGPPQPPALGRSWAAFTGLQLPHPPLQVLVLGKKVRRGEVLGRGAGSASPPSPADLRGVKTETE